MNKHLVWIVVFTAACDGERTPTVDAFTLGDSVYLAVENIGGHCSVTIDERQPVTTAEQIVGDYRPKQTISLRATATAGFAIGAWHHTAHDAGLGDPGTLSGSGEDVTSSAEVTLGDEPGCVWICCGSGADCAVSDPCGV